MKIQTLVATINQNDRLLPSKMNIQTDAIVGNQCASESCDEFEYNGHKIQYINTTMQGVGINRNMILMRSDSDVCVLADDDMTFFDKYETVVRSWFEKIPKADILIFNLEGEKKRYKNSKVIRITPLNYGKYGAARLVFRTKPVKLSGIMFNTMFGGGCQYSCGEDTLFLRDCLRKGLTIYGVPASIAKIEDGNSTWFKGYTGKYFYDKGVLYRVLDGRWCYLHTWIHCIRYRKHYSEYGWKKAIKQMIKGIKDATAKV